MIAKLKGLIDFIGEDYLIIDVNGVGYQLFCSSKTLACFTVGEAASLMVETHVREDHIHLYGFGSDAEKQWFSLLTTVQGVGNRVALAIMSLMSPDQLTQAIMAGDKTAFTQVSGVGPKLAGRVVTELKDKVAKLSVSILSGALGAGKIGSPMPASAMTGAEPVDFGATSALEDAVSALSNLGYGRSESFGAVGRAAKNLPENASVQDLIREALKEFA